MKFDKAVALTSLPYGSESWTIKARYINRVKSVEMRCSRRVKGCTTLHDFKNADTVLGKRRKYNQHKIKQMSTYEIE